MKKYEIAAFSDDELKKQIEDTEQRIADLKFNRVLEPIQSPAMLKNLRRDVARMKTLLNPKVKAHNIKTQAAKEKSAQPKAQAK